jgi:uncharacterized protein YukE
LKCGCLGVSRASIIVPIVVVVIALSLVGVILYQQQEISNLYGQNKELSNSNLTKDQDLTNMQNSYNDQISKLNNNYEQLNSTYTQTLASLRQITTLLNSSDSKLTKSQADYLELLGSYNNLSDSYTSMSTNLTVKIDELRNSIAGLSQEFGGLDGVFILNYTYTKYAGLTWQHTFTLVLYNALETANVTVRVYGQGSKDFTYSMPAYSKRTFAESWAGSSIGGEDYSLIIIESVQR